ncbi:glycosyltransferase [Paracoccus nototheniae]|uniref:Glycosyltransferase n=1 Tax=Paracoccus nototheniae TaxID=2489002 RepID=A0ABW4DTZ9_9RHOB|nr:glycosyltransferase [Paracoccus nototheniae]
MRIQVLGLCRFSLLVQGDFQTTGEDLDRNRAILYDPARLERRMRWFETLCVPSLAAQGDPDFTLIVATGTDLPEPWIGRLRACAQAVPQIRIEQFDPGRHAALCRQALARHADPLADIVAQFRMDDDDAVARDYVQRIREDHALAAPLAGPHHPVVINYTSGMVVELKQGRLHLHAEKAQNWGLAQTFYFPGGEVRSLMNYRHDKVWATAPTIAIPGRIMWIRGHHDVNDSRGHLIGNNRLPTDEAELTRMLRRRFGLNPAAVRAALTLPLDQPLPVRDPQEADLTTPKPQAPKPRAHNPVAPDSLTPASQTPDRQISDPQAPDPQR